MTSATPGRRAWARRLEPVVHARAEAPVPEPVRGSLVCTYCRAPIPAEAFTYWSQVRRLVWATCPACRRRVTILAATWRRRAGRAEVSG